MLRTAITTAACIATVAACAPAAQRPAPPAPPAPPPATAAAKPTASVKANGYAQKVIVATNAFRKDNGLAALEPDARLIQIAQAHAGNMARQDKYGDTDRNGHILDGHDVAHRIKTGGYAYGHIAENVGYQLNRRGAVASMMDGWKASPGHRRNMLLPDVTQIGVGAAQGRSGRWYFVQLFGRPPDSRSASKRSN